MKNILVIGANGMLGWEAVDYFNSMDGYSAKGLSRLLSDCFQHDFITLSPCAGQLS